MCGFTILSYSAFNSVFVANFASFVFKPESFTRFEILDSLSNFFFALSLNQECHLQIYYNRK